MGLKTIVLALVALTVAGQATAQVMIGVHLEAVDLFGDPISEISAGSDFELRVFVEDVRTTSEIPDVFGVFSAYVGVPFDPALISFQPDSVVLEPFFNAPQLDTRIDASTPGLVRAGGATTSVSPPGSDPQLLWSATFRADAVGIVEFGPFFEEFSGDPVAAEWLIYARDDALNADNVQFADLELTIVPEPSSAALLLLGLAAVALVIRTKMRDLTQKV